MTPDKKDCETCKHGELSIILSPCKSCKSDPIMYTNWEPLFPAPKPEQLPQVEPVQKAWYSMEDMENYGKQLLKDISTTFLYPFNQDKADKKSDKDVFQALGETILNFPLPAITNPPASPVNVVADGWIKEKAEELWDEYSEYMDDDLDSCQRFAGQSIMTKRQFEKLIASLPQPPVSEQSK
ncbi:MAG: hypothetical protein V4538_14935 [Bacteroidota bacterium]